MAKCRMGCRGGVLGYPDRGRGTADSIRTAAQRRNPLVAQGSPRRQHGALRPPAWPDQGDRSCVI